MAKMVFSRLYSKKPGFPSVPKFGLTRKPFLFNISCILYNHILILDTTHSHTHTHTHGQGDSAYSTFQQQEKHSFGKCRSFRGNVEYVEFWGPMLNQNVLLSAEMLNMLNVLGKLEGDPWPENSTYSTYQQKEAHFRKYVVFSVEMLKTLNSGAAC